MATLPRPRLVLGFAFVLAALGLTVPAEGQPAVRVTATVAGGPAAKKAKGEKDDRDVNEAIHLPVEREAKNKI